MTVDGTFSDFDNVQDSGVVVIHDYTKLDHDLSNHVLVATVLIALDQKARDEMTPILYKNRQPKTPLSASPNQTSSDKKNSPEIRATHA